MPMLSRVAEHLYWMSRYLERAENTARLIGVQDTVALDLPKHARPAWSALIDITGTQAPFSARYDAATETHVTRFLVADDDNPGSIMSSLRFARENARTVRDIIPREAWEQINRLYLHGKDRLADGLPIKRRHSLLQDVVLGVQQVIGILEGGMSHDAGYDFMRIGCNLERADMTTRILDVRSSNLDTDDGDALKPFENILWMSVLRSLTAYQMYRRHMQADVRREAVLEFLFQDSQFPRAFCHCLCEIESFLLRLPRNRAVLSCIGELKADILSLNGDALGKTSLSEFIDDLQIRLNAIHAAIASIYFGSLKLDDPAD